MSAQPSRHFTKESTKFLIVTLEHKENNPAKIITRGPPKSQCHNVLFLKILTSSKLMENGTPIG
jgi:hypothetical protein